MQHARSFQFVLFVFVLAIALQPSVAEVVIATVPVGEKPSAVAVNPATNKAYVVGSSSNPGTVTVIDGATNNTTSVSVGDYPIAVAVNEVTNRIYVANECGNDVTCSSYFGP